MKITAEPRSDQWNADDFLGSPQTFTIAGVKEGGAEQKYDIALAEGNGRVWRPPLTILRLLIAAWGDESDAWIGRRVTLFRDDSVKFGHDAVGGIRISQMSDLPGGKPFQVKVMSSRGKRTLLKVQPLTEAPTQQSPEPTAEQIAASASIDELRDWWHAAGPELRVLIEARRAELTAGDPQ